MNKTQREWVEEKIRANGEITRNEALQNYISRLGAIVCNMRQDGWNIDSFNRGGNYVYKLVTAPTRISYVYDLIDGVRVARKVIHTEPLQSR